MSKLSEEPRKRSSSFRRLIVGITGASGIVYGARLLEALEGVAETHLVVTGAAEKVMDAETSLEIDDLSERADAVYDPGDMAAPPASGSYPVDGVAVAPCSMKTLGSIAAGIADNLVLRAADIAMKEGRPLVLVPRETPLSDVHLKNMSRASSCGATVLPASPGFYHSPKSVGDMVDFVVGRVLDVLGINHELYERWGR